MITQDYEETRIQAVIDAAASPLRSFYEFSYTNDERGERAEHKRTMRLDASDSIHLLIPLGTSQERAIEEVGKILRLIMTCPEVFTAAKDDLSIERYRPTGVLTTETLTLALKKINEDFHDSYYHQCILS